MRRLLTGTDDKGRSCIIEEAEMPFASEAARPGRTRVEVYETHECPPPVRPPGHGDHIDLGVDTGLIRWQVIRFGPDFTIGMHHSDTLDFDMVLEGEVDLVLDDGAHHLAPGDCVVLTGVDHAWKSGPEGFAMNVMSVGTPPRS